MINTITTYTYTLVASVDITEYLELFESEELRIFLLFIFFPVKSIACSYHTVNLHVPGSGQLKYYTYCSWTHIPCHD